MQSLFYFFYGMELEWVHVSNYANAALCFWECEVPRVCATKIRKHGVKKKMFLPLSHTSRLYTRKIITNELSEPLSIHGEKNTPQNTLYFLLLLWIIAKNWLLFHSARAAYSLIIDASYFLTSNSVLQASTFEVHATWCIIDSESRLSL